MMQQEKKYWSTWYSVKRFRSFHQRHQFRQCHQPRQHHRFRQRHQFHLYRLAPSAPSFPSAVQVSSQHHLGHRSICTVEFHLYLVPSHQVTRAPLGHRSICTVSTVVSINTILACWTSDSVTNIHSYNNFSDIKNSISVIICTNLEGISSSCASST